MMNQNRAAVWTGVGALLLLGILLCVFSAPIQDALGPMTFHAGETTSAVKETPVRYGQYIPGVYLATAEGYESTVTVTVEVDETAVTELTLQADGESPLGRKAAQQLKAAILEAQTAELDAVAGATYTSNAVLEAVRAALREANGV